MREVNRIIIHCSATPPSMDIGVEVIRDWHVNGNGWSDVGYHYVIKRDGTLQVGRPVQIQGAHTQGYNTDSIGVCYVGGVDEDGDPEDNRTLAQEIMMECLVKVLQSMYDCEVKGHRDFTDMKECPSFDVGEWIESLNI